ARASKPDGSALSAPLRPFQLCRHPHSLPAVRTNLKIPLFPNLSRAFPAPAASAPNGTARTPARSPHAWLLVAMQSPSPASRLQHGQKSPSAPANSNSPPSKLRLAPPAGKRLQQQHAKFLVSPPSHQCLAAPLPAYTFRASAQAARRPKISTSPPPR